MKVFVTGGTGAIGRFTVPELVRAGHDVTAMARSDAKAAQLEQQGARAARVSIFDEAALKDAFAGHDAVCNLATSIPPVAKSVSMKNWRENDRIRQEGSTAVVNAAIAAGVGRVVQESITFMYPDRGDAWIDESVALETSPLGEAIVTSESNAARFAKEGATGVVLRFGLFYGPGSESTEQFLRAARRHVGPVAGPPGAFQSSIHVADAGRAVVAALALPSGTYNVVDDEPLTKKAYARALGAALGKRPWLLLPGRLVRLGGKKSAFMSRSQRVSNGAIKDATNWAPTYPSAREGWNAVVGEMV
jgi:nucleoside-diphosphate-sugar epimerase